MKERAREHWRAARPARKTGKVRYMKDGRRKIEEVSHMKEHQDQEHEGEEMRFKFSVKAVCKTALERQVKETVVLKLLKKEGKHNILNLKT